MREIEEKKIMKGEGEEIEFREIEKLRERGWSRIEEGKEIEVKRNEKRVREE